MLKQLLSKYKLYFYIGALILFIALALTIIIQGHTIKTIKTDRNTYKNSMNAALSECIAWRNKDSLSVAKNDVLTLRIAELEKYKNEDLNTINSLKKKNESLEKLIIENSKTKIEIQTVTKDSIVYVKDEAQIIKTIDWSDEWAEFHGKIQDDKFEASLTNRDSLVVGTTIEYKRFLGFLWKTNKIKNQNVYITSKNPHTEIENIECINTIK